MHHRTLVCLISSKTNYNKHVTLCVGAAISAIKALTHNHLNSLLEQFDMLTFLTFHIGKCEKSHQ